VLVLGLGLGFLSSSIVAAQSERQSFVYLPLIDDSHPLAVTAAGVEKIDVCHITGEHDFGDGPMPIGHVITIADPAYSAHIEHGDPEQWSQTELPDGTQGCLAVVACPCWSTAEIGAIGLSYTPNQVDYLPNSFPTFSTFALVENRIATDEFPYGAFQVAQIDFSDVNECRYFNADFIPGAPEPLIRVLEVTESEAAACKADIDAQRDFLITSGVDVVCAGNLCE
jgi:hypothetical protein